MHCAPPWEKGVPPRAGLAPMAGVTDAATRVLCFEQGADWAVSEMLSAKGLGVLRPQETATPRSF